MLHKTLLIGSGSSLGVGVNPAVVPLKVDVVRNDLARDAEDVVVPGRALAGARPLRLRLLSRRRAAADVRRVEEAVRALLLREHAAGAVLRGPLADGVDEHA